MDLPFLAVLGAFGAVLASVWGYVRSGWAKLSSYVVTTTIFESTAGEALLIYLNQTMRPIAWGPRSISGANLPVRRAGARARLVMFEIFSPNGLVYRLGRWRFLFVVREGKITNAEEHGDTSPIWPTKVKVMWLRGAFKYEQLAIDSAKAYNHLRDRDSVIRRHTIKRVYGMSRKTAARSGNGDGGSFTNHATPSDQNTLSAYRTSRPLGYSLDELSREDERRGLAVLALNPEADAAVTEARRWMASEQWFLERGIPWRRGWLLHGEPGNGKTALGRSVAEMLDLPLYTFDLASMANDEMQSAWTTVLSDTPCMVTFEDFDNVFHGRENVVPDGELTFDCVLNCLDGVTRADGLFVIVTTNHLEHIDPALGLATAGDVSTRPGRLDRIIEMTAPSADGRRHIARRILGADSPDIEALVQTSVGMTGAQFQYRCEQVALSLFWSGGKVLADQVIEPQAQVIPAGEAVDATHWIDQLVAADKKQDAAGGGWR